MSTPPPPPQPFHMFDMLCCENSEIDSSLTKLTMNAIQCTRDEFHSLRIVSPSSKIKEDFDKFYRSIVSAMLGTHPPELRSFFLAHCCWYTTTAKSDKWKGRIFDKFTAWTENIIIDTMAITFWANGKRKARKKWSRCLKSVLGVWKVF